MKIRLNAGGLALMGALAIGVGVLAFALVRFGGPQGVSQRIAARIPIEAPHPDFVPTPLVAESPDQPVEVALLIAATQTEIKPAVAPAATRTPEPFGSSGGAGGQLVRLERETDTDISVVPPALTTAPAPTATPTLPSAHRISGLAHMWQTWNNCGPATLAMNLSYYQVKSTQEQVRLVLRPEKDDKNVNPEELAAYARSQGLQAIARVNGDAHRLRSLILAGVPVLVETWYEPKPNDGMGHYRLLVGYDDAAKEWIAYDSYESTGLDRKAPYAGIRMSYAELEKLWHVFGRAYVVVYDAARSAAVEAIVGADGDEAAMWQRALMANQALVRSNPKDAFAWFNLGTALTAQGDFDGAAKAYDQARRIKLPWRMLWYQFGPFSAYYEVGRYDEVIALADATIRTAKNVEELFFWRGLAQQAKGDIPSARASWEKALQLQPNYADARAALATLP